MTVLLRHKPTQKRVLMLNVPCVVQELAAMRSQLTGTVNVEVDAAPQQDLNRVLEEIRAQYEAINEKHRREQEVWFNEKVRIFPPCVHYTTSNHGRDFHSSPDLSLQSATLSKEVAISTETIQTSKTEIGDLRRTLQGLEIELQSQLSMVRRNRPPTDLTL